MVLLDVQENVDHGRSISRMLSALQKHPYNQKLSTRLEAEQNPTISNHAQQTPMKVSLDVADRKEAEAARLAWTDPAIRAFVVIMGTLGKLPSQRAKERVLTFVKDHFNEMEGVTQSH